MYYPARNKLTIAILKAKNLKAKDINGKSGEYMRNNFENCLSLSVSNIVTSIKVFVKFFTWSKDNHVR